MRWIRDYGWIAGLVGAFIGYVALVESLQYGFFLEMGMVGLGAMTALVGGRSLPIPLRLFITVVFFDFGYGMCLVGRTMGPGLTIPAVGMAAFFFGMMALYPFLAVFRIWRVRTALVLMLLSFPVCFAVAAGVAGYEEAEFVRKHEAKGVGPTPRWTVSNHWLAYSATERKLTGSD